MPAMEEKEPTLKEQLQRIPMKLVTNQYLQCHPGCVARRDPANH